MNQPSFEFNKQLELEVLLNGLTEVTKEYTHNKVALGQSYDDLVIPDGITSIGDRAFAWWYDLISITIPDSVTSIGEYAFGGVSELKTMTFKGKTLDEVRSMKNYPWGISPEKISVQVS
jgi:hypothetical protein